MSRSQESPQEDLFDVAPPVDHGEHLDPVRFSPIDQTAGAENDLAIPEHLVSFEFRHHPAKSR